MTTTKSPVSMKQVKMAFDALSQVFYSAYHNYADQLLEQCKAEEKSHRGFMPEFKRCHTGDSVSVGDSAKMFAVKRVAEYLLSGKYPSGQDYLHMQKSCFIAAGIVHEFDHEVRKAWLEFDVESLAALDYCDFVKVNK